MGEGVEVRVQSVLRMAHVTVFFVLFRSLRDKVTLIATMSLSQDLPLVAELEGM